MAKFTEALRKPVVATESESLITEAAAVNDNKESIDPVTISENAEFEAEIARLKAQTEAEAQANPQENVDGGDAAATDPVDPVEPSAGDNADPAEPAPAEDTPKADAGEEAPANVDEDSFDKAADEAVNSDDETAPELEAAADKPMTNEEQRVAVESFHAVLDQYNHLMNAHETGRITKLHVGLCSATTNRASRVHGIEKPAFSLESGDGIMAKVAEFIRELLARIKKAFASMFEWLRDFLRGYKAATGKYEASKQGVRDRLAYFEKQPVAVTEADLRGKTLKLNALSNWRGAESNDVAQAVSDLVKFADHMLTCIGDTTVAATFVANLRAAELYAKNGGSSFGGILAAKAITPEMLFGKVGNLNRLGDSSYIRDNVSYGDNANPGVFAVNNLIGGARFVWNLETDDSQIKLQSRAESVRRVDFRYSATVPTADFTVPVLTPHSAEVVMGIADQLVTKSDALVDLIGSLSKNTEMLKNQSASILQLLPKAVEAGTITEQESFILASVCASSADIYARTVVTPVAKLITCLRGTADNLITWCIQSTKVVDETITKK